ncbi:hypothetical protein CI109_105006 [Kwoniella shandongensis]|uniref:Uncharacterized protein n=1 Tax=Kwoniella shandongensis TaxID=1734106 RepID=A0A5M6BWR9_9TREE|nr:uncharacterized protein CI109_004397 [Kwoniella shandongensis]KAA5527336.1 hypothetical protein CI109_004397 [Kwoniella shandongensis]
MPIPSYRPKPAPAAIFKDEPLPESKANLLSRLVFHWVTPIMRAGYTRPLEIDDLWTLTNDLECKTIANQIQTNLNGNAQTKVRRFRFPMTRKVVSNKDCTDDNLTDDEEKKTSVVGVNERQGNISLIRAMYRTVWWKWWKAVLFKGIAAALQITSPLMTKLLIDQLTLAHNSAQVSPAGQAQSELPKPIGYSIGLAFALFVMLQTASLCSYQALQRGSVIGFMMRAALIDLISRKSMRLSPSAKVEMTHGRITTMVSADASFLDFSAPMTLDLVVQPVQIVVGLGLLIWTLGYSALVGLAVLAAAGPIQALMFKLMIKTRQYQLTYVDARLRLLSEVVTSIRSIKLFAYVEHFSNKVSLLRKKELVYLKKNGLNRSLMNATMAFIPTLAAVLTFITYGLSGHDLDAAIIFSGLQYFNVLKTPISFLPMAFSAVSDASVGIGRISALLQAEEIPIQLNIQHNARYAIDVKGDFQFESLPEDWQSESKPREDDQVDEKGTMRPESRPFVLRDINLRIQRGSLVCIVGKVGCGKSALLSAMIDEMKLVHGHHAIFSGPVSYVPQQAWIHSGSVRDNITFSSSANEIDWKRYNAVIDACALRTDIEAMSKGDLTDVGEKGLLLSGGQRQRISLARAAYSTSSIVLLDDPLSAVDPNVAHHILQRCILSPNGPLGGRTRVMVSHRVDVLQRADWVVVMDRDEKGDGRIVQKGTYCSLRTQKGLFQTLIKDHDTELPPEYTAQLPSSWDQPSHMPPGEQLQPTPSSLEGEERQTGSIPWSTYRTYLSAIGNPLWTVLFCFMLIMTQVASVMNTLFLGFWSAGDWGLSQGVYMGIYAGLGLAVGSFTFGASYTMFLAGLRASYSLFHKAWGHVMRSPTRWHDQTPSGRIINRLSKDIEMLDDRMAFAWETLLVDGLAAFGTFGLILYTYPWLGISFIPLSLFYYVCGSYYRSTSREVKRIDSITRSHIYSSFGEQLAGSSVIRVFGKQAIFENRLQDAINVEGRAYILTLVIQRWLGVRLDLSSNLLVLLIAIVGTALRNTIDPSKFGVVFSYTIAAASLFSNLVSLYAQVELEMNNAERIIHYTSLPLEPPSIRSTDPPPSSWPSEGDISFHNLSLRYSSTSPYVLKNLNFSIRGGEKVGVVGRTGAGKSSLIAAIMKMSEIEGEIRVDELDLGGIGVDTVRSRIGIIPQDPFLFEGTIRDNLDPLGQHTDAHLKSLLSLIHSDRATSPMKEKFRLDARVTNGGENFSAGEKQLLALIRALARKTKILILDEATSSVDPETDALIQRIIQTHLRGVTLLSIAHRLHTVANYDRILVLDAGQIVEFDTPLKLFDRADSIFRQLCRRERIDRADLIELQHKT